MPSQIHPQKMPVIKQLLQNASLAKHCFQFNALSSVHHAHSFLYNMLPVQPLETFYDAQIKRL
jgi:hypothetical protein